MAEPRVDEGWPEIQEGRFERSVLENLFQECVRSLDRAYCPYSGFPVGAALLTEEGRVHTGVNVENSSYGLTICAERGAVSAAVAAGSFKFSTIVVATRAGKPVSPCGACRQVLAEFNSRMPVFLICVRDGTVQRTTMDRLLPMAFSDSDLFA